jgi:hypothetical protein
MNNSTWFYSYKPIPVKDVGYYINGITTTEELFLEYQGSRTVNLVDGKIASKEMAGHYARANNNNLSVVPIENKTTYFNTNPNTTKLVIPVYCVIFDRGTQVVANTEAFFISN